MLTTVNTLALDAPEFQSYFEGCKSIYDKAWPSNPHGGAGWDVTAGPKYLRVTHHGSVHSFVARSSGDVLKPASFKTPAKHARGNIYDDHNGLKGMGPYGPAYLR